LATVSKSQPALSCPLESSKSTSPRRRSRVAPAGCPTGALARTGLGDCHHPALPRARLAATAPLPSEVPVTCAPMSMHRAGFPPEAHASTDRLCSAGSEGASVPRLPRSYAVLRLPHHRRSRLRLPLALRPTTNRGGVMRASQVAGTSSYGVPRFLTPSVAPTPRPSLGSALLPSRASNLSTPEITQFRG